LGIDFWENFGIKLVIPAFHTTVQDEGFQIVDSKNVKTLKKQILAQQPCGVRAFPFGISRQICFFSEVGLSDFHLSPKMPNRFNRDRTSFFQ
jgi:hypothetical protein